MPHIRLDGISLYYEDHGTGRPLLLLAGLASDSQSWGPAASELSRDFRVIALDNRGVGRTTPQDAAMSIEAMAEDCMALVRRLALSKVHLLGHSMGGMVAQHCAAVYPEMIDRLILAATSARVARRNRELFDDWAQRRESGQDLRRWFRSIFFWIFSRRFFDDQPALDEALRQACDYPWPQSSAAFGAQVRALCAFDGTGQLSKIAAKTMVLSGSEDRLFDAADCRALAEGIPGAACAMIPDAAHALHLEQPKAFCRAVREFLD
ncbi:MAG: alpha/beta fold hydrolase [Elusimicrobia bacterium]|nr:alpha/beta fold hydrolase [Elusimicrobiota bacterium]